MEIDITFRVESAYKAVLMAYAADLLLRDLNRVNIFDMYEEDQPPASEADYLMVLASVSEAIDPVEYYDPKWAGHFSKFASSFKDSAYLFRAIAHRAAVTAMIAGAWNDNDYAVAKERAAFLTSARNPD